MSNKKMTRRDMLKVTAAGGAATAFAGKAYGAVCVDQTPIGITAPAPGGGTMDNTGCPVDADLYPVSPFILNPFTDALPVPKAMKPGYRNPDGTLATATQTQWAVRQKLNDQPTGISVPGAGAGYQDAFGERPMANDGTTFNFKNPKTGATTTKTMNYGGAKAGTHQLFPGAKGTSYANLTGQAKTAFDLLAADPILYHIRIGVNPVAFTTSNVQAINKAGAVLPGLPAGATAAAGTVPGTFKLPASAGYNFNGAFVANAMINLEYGRPIIVRMENDL
ncbi:MAG: twin-arginine translocation signal domain-containing protein, partial [Anaeromyxobacteraceae bacterium]